MLNTVIHAPPYMMLLLLLLHILCWPFCCFCLVHRVPIRCTGSLRTRMLSTGKWLEEVQRFTSLDADDNDELENYRGFCTISITLGTPPQQLVVALDTNFPFFWVIDCRCTLDACFQTKDWDYKKHCFNTSLTTSLHGDGSPVEFPCLDCVPESEAGTQYQPRKTGGYFHRERLQIGPLRHDTQAFVSADYIEKQWINFPFDGILGFDWPSKAILGHQPPLFNMMDQLDRPVFTIWADWSRPYATGGPEGFLTIGGTDNDHCIGPWEDVKIESRASNWQFRFYGFKIGKELISYRSYSAEMKTGTALIGGPPHLINMIIVATHAKYREEDNLYIVPCDQRSQMDPFEFILSNGNTIQVPPNGYILDLNLTDGNCALGVFRMYPDEFMADWILGNLFMDSYCTMFDYLEGQLSFARAKDAVSCGEGEKSDESLHVQ